MAGGNKNKIINDPVYGFLAVPSPLIYDVIQHPYFQRLRRIRQLGLTELVYPGATHTRFHHALGALNLMVKALDVLKQKGVEITEQETEAACLGILLHDIGHGPYSHTLEHSLIKGVSHETISTLLMARLNHEMEGKLDLAIRIFNGQYPEKPFLGQLISGQLDMDRLDYLSRDSFYTGVSEGIVGADRIIHMLNVSKGQLVVEEKGIYSVEKFLVARRLMYWQVYLHKTVIAADELLISILQRARFLASQGHYLGSYHPLVHFLGREIDRDKFDEESLNLFVLLDDYDIMTAVKSWQFHEDPVLARLASAMLYRQLPKIQVQNEPVPHTVVESLRSRAKQLFGLETTGDAEYFVRAGVLMNHAYISEGGGIWICRKDGTLVDVAEASDNYNLSALKKTVTRYFVTYWAETQ
ncbi:MAG: HD domain-containing protein [Bacteroidia bacterium]|nr:HD domain-containing protein [Bacteroidia bacterium]